MGVSNRKSEKSGLVNGENGREGVGGFDSTDWPMTRPVAAAATTVPVPTSYMPKKKRLLASVFLAPHGNYF